MRKVDTKCIAVAHCSQTRVAVINGKIIIVCPHNPPIAYDMTGDIVPIDSVKQEDLTYAMS